MKKKRLSRGAGAAIMAAVYLLVLVLGSAAITEYPLRKQRRALFRFADSYAGALAEPDAEIPYISPQIYLVRVGADGIFRCLWEPAPGLVPCADAAMGGERAFRVSFGKAPEGQTFSMFAAAGVPLPDGGALLVVENVTLLPEVLTAFFCYFTVLYWLSLYFIVSSLRRRRRLDEARQTYIDNVTHALKTPVASIKALSETLCDGVESDPERQKQYCALILKEANRQDRMIRDVLALSRLQNHGTDFTRSAVDPAEVFPPLLEKYALLFDYSGIAFRAGAGLSALPTLWTNAECVRSILSVLLDNALKFVPEGGSVTVDAAVGGRSAVITVRDDGPGIASEDLPHIFDRFFKCGGERGKSGSGLGLAIARENALGLRERIWAESEPGAGSAFRFTLRLR